MGIYSYDIVCTDTMYTIPPEDSRNLRARYKIIGIAGKQIETEGGGGVNPKKISKLFHLAFNKNPSLNPPLALAGTAAMSKHRGQIALACLQYFSHGVRHQESRVSTACDQITNRGG